MKTIVESINEARELVYVASILDIDANGAPLEVKMTIDAKYAKQFENWLQARIDKEFMDAGGVTNGWEAEYK